MVGSNSSILAIPLLDFPSVPVTMSAAVGVPNGTSIYLQLNSTGLDNEDLAISLGPTNDNLQWNP
jgi:hypothetical protein